MAALQSVRLRSSEALRASRRRADRDGLNHGVLSALINVSYQNTLWRSPAGAEQDLSVSYYPNPTQHRED